MLKNSKSEDRWKNSKLSKTTPGQDSFFFNNQMLYNSLDRMKKMDSRDQSESIKGPSIGPAQSQLFAAEKFKMEMKVSNSSGHESDHFIQGEQMVDDFDNAYISPNFPVNQPNSASIKPFQKHNLEINPRSAAQTPQSKRFTSRIAYGSSTMSKKKENHNQNEARNSQTANSSSREANSRTQPKVEIYHEEHKYEHTIHNESKKSTFGIAFELNQAKKEIQMQTESDKFKNSSVRRKSQLLIPPKGDEQNQILIKKPLGESRGDITESSDMVSNQGRRRGTNLVMQEEDEKYMDIDLQELIENEMPKDMHIDEMNSNVVKISDKVPITECCIIRHDNKWRLRWDLLIILLALFNCISIPLEVSFVRLQFINDTTYFVVGKIIDILFAFDIAVNFRTTYISEKTGTEVVEGKSIAKNYVFGNRFFVDLMASIPFDMLIPKSQDSTQTTQLLGLLKLVRLLRLGRIITFMKMRQDLKVSFKIFQMLALLLLIMHWVGCIIYQFVSERDSWLPPKDLNNQFTDFYDIKESLQFPVMFYYGLLLIVGNEMAPTNIYQSIFFSLTIIIGALVMAFIFGSIAAAMSSMGKQQNRFQDLADLVHSTMIQIKLPEELQNDIQDYLIQVNDSQDINMDYEKFINLLSPFLRHKVQKFLLNKVITQHSILNSSSQIAVNFIVQKLKNLIHLPGDEIIQQFTEGKEMYFIISGKCEAILQKQVFLKSVREVPGFENFIPFQLRLVIYKQRKANTNTAAKQSVNHQMSFQSLLISPDQNKKDCHRRQSKIMKAFHNEQKGEYFSPFKQNSPVNPLHLSNLRRMDSFRQASFYSASSRIKPPNANKIEDNYYICQGPQNYPLINDQTPEEFEEINYYELKIRDLNNGDHFGEIALLSNSKRTACVRSNEYTTISTLQKHDLLQLQRSFPNMVKQFYNIMLKNYNDNDIEFKKYCIRSIPYFFNLDDHILMEIIFIMKQSKFDHQSKIIKRGDNGERLYILTEGIVEVVVPFMELDLHFDYLNPGSNFCVYSSFNHKSKSIVNFVAKTNCVIESIELDDLWNLSKKYLELRDILNTQVVEQRKMVRTEFDFFRFNIKRFSQSNQLRYKRFKLDKSKAKIKKALRRFLAQYTHGEAQMPIALEAIRYLQQQNNERMIFQWVHNKEQDYIIKFMQRVRQFSVKQGKQFKLEDSYKYILEQIHRCENFEMLTVHELEQLQYRLMAESINNGEPLSIQSPTGELSALSLAKTVKTHQEIYQEQIQNLNIRINQLKMNMNQLLKKRTTSLETNKVQVEQDLIENIKLKIETLVAQKKIMKVKEVQYQMGNVNKLINNQQKELLDIRKKSDRFTRDTIEQMNIIQHMVVQAQQFQNSKERYSLILKQPPRPKTSNHALHNPLKHEPNIRHQLQPQLTIPREGKLEDFNQLGSSLSQPYEPGRALQQSLDHLLNNEESLQL